MIKRAFVKYFKLKKTNIDEPVLKAMMQLLQSFLSASIENELRYLAFLIFSNLNQECLVLNITHVQI